MTSTAGSPGGLRPLAGPASRTDLVAEAVRDAILSGELAPGETLVERRLSERLGVSKTPVREALISLAHTGLVTVAPNKGITVRRLDLRGVRQVYELRLLLEPWAALETTRAGSPDAVREAREALDAAGELLDSEDRAQLSIVNRRFHRALYAHCGNELVVSQLDGLQDLTALGVVSLLWDRWPTWRAEFGEHTAILAAVTEGDGAEVRGMVYEHISQSLTRLSGEHAAD